MKKPFGKILLATVLALTVSCGRDDDTTRTHSLPNNLNLTSQQLNKRFSADDIRRVYTNQPVPAQTNLIQKVYTQATAPADFKAEWPSFTKAVEMKGFINMSATPPGGDPNDDPTARSIVSTLQAFSKWKEITDKTNRPILQDAFSTDRFGDKMPDITNGRIVKNPDFHFGKIVGNNIPIFLELTFSKKEGGQIDADFSNPKDISIFPVGTIVKARGVKIHAEFFPYQNGWLFYSVAAPKLEKFEEKANDLTDIAENIIRWLRKKTGK